jgi:hypothetical protein
VNTGTGDGAIRLDLTNSTGITDTTGKAINIMPFTSGQVYTIDTTVPSVTINQAAGQRDPASSSPINFTVTFSEAVSGFATGDVSFVGSTAGGTLTGTVSGGSTTYNVAVSGMTSEGTVVASVPAGVATDAAGNSNTASTSTDNTVTYDTTASVEVRIGEDIQGSYIIPSGGKELPRFGNANGPVRVKSTDGVPIFTSQRAAFGNSFNELMGYPAGQLDTEYWFTYYDDIYMATWLMIGNPDPVETAHVEVYIGSGATPIATYDIPKGESVLPRFGIADGPVRVKSTNGVPIFTSQRAAYGNSFNELMGYPAGQLDTEYWFTYYDDIYMATWLMMGAP